MAKSKKKLDPVPHFWFCDVYRANVFYFTEWSLADFYIWLFDNRGIQLQPTNGADGKCIHAQGDIFIWTHAGAGPEVLGHECVHASYFILNARGIDIRSDLAETHAYLFGALFRQGLESMIKKK